MIRDAGTRTTTDRRPPTTDHRPRTAGRPAPTYRRWSVVGGRSPAAARLGLAVVFGLLAIVLRLPELDRYATIDESRWVGRSADFARYLDQGNFDNTFIVGHPGVTTMWLGLLGLGPDRAREFSSLEVQTDVTRRDGYLEALVAARYPLVLANAAAQAVIVWLAWGLFGPGPAAIGGLLMLLDPFFSAHSRLVHLDGLLASFMGVAALASVALWVRSDVERSRRGGSWAYMAIAAVATGLALLTKAPAIYLLAFVPAVAIVGHVRSGHWRQPSGWMRPLIALAAWLSLTALVCVVLWPALRSRPLTVGRQMLEFATRNAAGERENFFFGQPVEDPGALFYPVALMFRATPLMLLGLALLVYALVRWRREAPSWPAVLLVGYAVGFVLLLTFAQKKFDRYELPLFPVLDLLAGLGLWLAFSRLAVSGRQVGRPSVSSRRLGPWPCLALIVGISALAAWPLLSVYPYDLAYYNPLVGGGPAAQRVLFVGWGEGLDRAAGYLNAKPIVFRAPTVATAYHRVLEAHLQGNNAIPLDEAHAADYIVPYVNSLQRDQKAQVLAGHVLGREPEYVVRLNGIEYARVYPGPQLPVERLVNADFGGRLQLESVVLSPGSGQVRAAGEVLARLRWRPNGSPQPLVVVTQVVDSNGRRVVQDRRPLSDAFREDDLLIVDARLPLPSSLPPGGYSVEVLAEDSTSGRNLSLANGEPALVVHRLTVVRASGR